VHLLTKVQLYSQCYTIQEIRIIFSSIHEMDETAYLAISAGHAETK